MFAVLENSTRQSPFRLAACNQQDSVASTADHGGAFLQTELPLLFYIFRGAFTAPARRANTVSREILIQNSGGTKMLYRKGNVNATFRMHFIKVSQELLCSMMTVIWS